MYIAIEALIGAGKSTLVSKLSEKNKFTPFYEPVEANPFLELYYTDSQRWAYAMQVNLLFERYKMTQEAYLRSLRGETCLLDRSVYGDAAFAIVQKWDGYFTDKEYKSYRNMHSVLTSQLAYPELMLWLELSPKDAVERIKKRSRDCEGGIPLDYLEKLYDAYQVILSQLEGHTRIIKIDARQDTDTVARTVKNIIEKYRPTTDNDELFYTGR